MVLVENWFDEHALRMNGTGHGRNDFHKYRMTGGRFIPGTEYWCKVVRMAKMFVIGWQSMLLMI